jgi:hypothetical protein
MVAARQGRSINQLETIKLALGFDPVSFGPRDWGAQILHVSHCSRLLLSCGAGPGLELSKDAVAMTKQLLKLLPSSLGEICSGFEFMPSPWDR